MPPSPRQLFDEYRRQYKSNPADADASLLTQVRQELEVRLAQRPLQAEDVHVAIDFARYFGEDRNALIETLKSYLAQPLSVEEEAKARWQLVDNLALEERFAETVETQRAFLEWARQTLPPEGLLWVMVDSTQAMCWLQMGAEEEWLGIFHQLITQVPPTPENRRDRLLYMESAAVIVAKMGQVDQLLQISDSVQRLSEEDPAWERALEARLVGLQIAVQGYHALGDEDAIRCCANGVMELLESDAARQLHERQQMVLWHNLGSSFYLLQIYEFAIPALRRAVELNSFVEHTYLWLAASLWATTKDRAVVLPLLQAGALRATGNRGVASLGVDRWKQLPEFEGVADDAEFVAAVSPAP